MRRSLWLTIVLSLVFLSPASAAGVRLSSDPLWKALMQGPLDAAATRPAQPASAGKGGGSSTNSMCTATAACGAGSVSCSGSGTCTAVDQSCPEEQGYVTCGSVTIYCSPACPTFDCDFLDNESCDYYWDPGSNCCIADGLAGLICPNWCR